MATTVDQAKAFGAKIAADDRAHNHLLDDEQQSASYEWTGEHTSAMAAEFGVSVSDLGDVVIDAAERAYRRAMRESRAA